MLEQERKFLLLSMPETQSKIDIKQAYLIFEGNKHLRVRIINDTKAFLAFKIIQSAKIRTEYEYEIPLTDATEMYEASKYKLQKTRYKTTFNGNSVDIDVYPDGLAVVEIEYEKELNSLPEYCGEEITGVSKYSNVNIAYQQSFRLPKRENGVIDNRVMFAEYIQRCVVERGQMTYPSLKDAIKAWDEVIKQ